LRSSEGNKVEAAELKSGMFSHSKTNWRQRGRGTRGGQPVKKEGEKIMEVREAILDFQYSEKIKSGLIIGTSLLDQLESLKKDELSGGRKVLVWYLEGLLREMKIAENVLGVGRYGDLERKLMEVIGRIEMSQFQDAQWSFSEAISLATTSCQSSMSFLMEKKLV
jgi:hypothetical protein